MKRETSNWKLLNFAAILAAFVLFAGGARAQVSLLMEEPYGNFGAMNPTGHAAVYLSRVCSDDLRTLRRCRADELGVVISRYHKVDGYDWLAVPLLPYLYAVDSFDQVPSAASSTTEVELRDAWRRAHLQDIAPDTVTGGTPAGEWTELVGEAYDRKMYAFRFDSTPQQDDAFIATWNDKRNKSHFNLLFHNCADFARVVMDFYYPHAVHRNFIADVGLMTPKQAAHSVTKYANKHPDVHMQIYEIPQVAGDIPRSHRIDGTTEALLKSKKYVIPLAVLNPYIAGALGVAYVADGRYSPPKDAPLMAELKPLLPDNTGRTVLPLLQAEAGGGEE